MDADGFARVRLGERNRARLDHIRTFAKELDWTHRSKKDFLKLISLDINTEPILKDLAGSGELVGPIARYLGVFPVLASSKIWYSPNRSFVGGSQKFHLDAEDIRQVKCFIPLDPVDEETGPLHVIPADKSLALYTQLINGGFVSKRNQKTDDEVVERFCPRENWIKLVGDVGDVFLVDT